MPPTTLLATPAIRVAGLRTPSVHSVAKAAAADKPFRVRWVFLAVPLLGTFKIVCDRVQSLAAIGHFLGTEAREMQAAPP